MNFEIIRDPKDFISLEKDWGEILTHNGDSNFYLSFEWFYSLIFLIKNSGWLTMPSSIYKVGSPYSQLVITPAASAYSLISLGHSTQ